MGFTARSGDGRGAGSRFNRSGRLRWVLYAGKEPAAHRTSPSTGCSTSVQTESHSFISTGRLTYRELCTDAEALAQGCSLHGALQGDTISFQMPNWSETVLIVLAAMRLLGLSVTRLFRIYRG